MKGLRAKLGLTAVSTLLAALAGWWVVQAARPEAVPMSFVDNSAEVAELLARRTGTNSNVTGRGTFHLEPIDEATARTLFGSGKRFVYHPLCYFRHKPGLDNRTRWPEHPDGAWFRRTNSRGLREDDEAGLENTDLGVLVTGDSHTSGACNNSESFANLLEASLRERYPEQRVEVLNTGVGGYSFYNYLGVLREFIDQAPDVFVVAVYGGNDFKGVVRPHHYFRGTLMPPLRRNYYDKIGEASAVSAQFLAQSLGQVLYFQESPDQIEVALDAALVTTGEIRRLCSEAGIRLVYVYIPPAYEASWPELDELTARAREVLDLTEADLFVSDQLRRRFFDGLERLGVEVLDMGPVFRAREQPCYWSRDLHINLLGQRLIAESLDEFLAQGGGQLGAEVVSAIPDGPYTEVGPQGALLAQGAYRNGLRDGAWILRYPGGQVRCEGRWSAGRRTGRWSWWFEDGTPKKEGAYEEGHPHGPWREWYRNGQLRQESHWTDTLPTGLWNEYLEDGTHASQGTFVQGLEHGEWTTWQPNGELKLEVSFRMGRTDGVMLRYGPEGQLLWRGRNRDGVRTGPWEFWHAAGARAARGEYEQGERTGAWSFWTEAGELDEQRSGVYREGQRARG